ncbi:MAG: glutamine amidotransferase family protein [Deltaproteobacteria bacterium]|nr:glutamine amidotransferase family protein [Deltaproteobacteria bacterium]
MHSGGRHPFDYRKDISGCGLTGLIHVGGKKVGGEAVIRSICLMNERGNGLGAGFAAYGIYPEYHDHYAFHVMYDHLDARRETEQFLERLFAVDMTEEIPTRPTGNIRISPFLYRYFVKPSPEAAPKEMRLLPDDDYVVQTVFQINGNIDGAFVFSSGKNMGAFKGVGLPGDIAEFFRIDEYEAYIWTAHNRFPTNTPGWWGGAHPFTLLDWSIVHNGEISSYGINKRYLEMFGYRLTLLTDTEVVTYLLDLLIRKNGLDVHTACKVLAAPFWKDIDELPDEERQALRAVRMMFGSAMMNGPFAILFAFNGGLVGFNDRVKLRPLVVGRKGDFFYMASEESAIRTISPDLDEVWAPRAGQPVVVRLGKGLTS